jgi:probable HAF family extracellular repeat protein
MPPGFITAANVSVNASGHVSGVLLNKDSTQRRAFFYSDHNLTLLLPEQSKAFALNDKGAVAGEAAVHGKDAMNPVLWKGKIAIDLGACCGGSATAINNEGQAVGNFYDQAGHYHAFLWDSKSGLQSIAPELDYSSAVAINAKGHVLIQAFSAAYLFADGKLTPVELSAKFTSHPRALNDCDVIVGSFGTNADKLTAFSWDRQHGFQDLNQRISADSGWKLEAASGINNHGEIVGWGDNHGLDDAGFLLIPEK